MNREKNESKLDRYMKIESAWAITENVSIEKMTQDKKKKRNERTQI